MREIRMQKREMLRDQRDDGRRENKFKKLNDIDMA